MKCENCGKSENLVDVQVPSSRTLGGGASSPVFVKLCEGCASHG